MPVAPVPPRGPMTPQQRMLLEMMLSGQVQFNQAPQQPQQQPDLASMLGDLLKAGGAKEGLGGLGEMFGFGGSGAASTAAEGAGALTPASQAAWNAQAGAASQASWNAGATAAGGGLPAEAAAATNPYAAAVAAILANGYQFNRMSKKTKTETGMGALKKAAKDPLTYVMPVASIASALFGDKDMYLKEHRRLLDLQKDGINVPNQLVENTRLSKGRSRDELMQIEQDKIKRGQYGNTAFASSRNEKDLKPEDIWGYSTFFKKYGNDWLGKFNEQQRRDIAQAALDSGAVNEHHGTVDVKWGPELEGRINSILGSQGAPNAAAMASSIASQPQQKPGQYGPGKTMDQMVGAISGQMAQAPQPQPQQPSWKPGQTVRLSPGVYRGPDGKITNKGR